MHISTQAAKKIGIGKTAKINPIEQARHEAIVTRQTSAYMKNTVRARINSTHKENSNV